MLPGPDARLRFIALLMVAILLLVVAQLVRLQVLEHPEHQAEAERLVERQYGLPDPALGCIWDRNGNLLVGNSPYYDIGAEVRLVSDPQEAATALASLLGQTPEELVTKLTVSPEEEEQTIVWHFLAKQVPESAVAEIEKLEYSWITLTPTWLRQYTEGDLAAHVLGFMNESGQGYGLHSYHMRLLQGERVANVGAVTGSSDPMPQAVADERGLPYPGVDLRLTFDRTIQAYIEGELEKALLEYNAPSGTILVIDPRSGEILAMASSPSYEPYNYAAYAEQGQTALFQNPAISQAYEPGSVFKIVTVAAALDSGKADLNWSYEDKGVLEYGGVVIRNWSRAAYGHQDLKGVLTHSLNVGVSTLSTQVMGSQTFYRYLRAFGFGQLTEVDLSGEASGQMHMPDDWDWEDSFLATNAFGQGIAVTPLQMTAAAAAIANDGVMMQPHVVAERLYPDGRRVTIPPKQLGQPISAETAQIVTELMAQAVAAEVPKALVPGYRIAGKTGTAQIPGVGGYEPDDIIASFIGFGPLPDPQILVFIKLDRPNVPAEMRWGSQTAAPLFQRIASRLFVLLGIPPSELVAQQ